MSHIFAGQIEEVNQSEAINDKGDVVTNVIVGFEKAIAGTSIMEKIKRTLVLFRKEGLQAARELSEGDYAVFSEAQRRPRVYQDKKGMDVHVVDIRATGFTKVSKKQYQDNLAALMDNMLPEKDLHFTDEDAQMLQKAAEKAEARDTEENAKAPEEVMPV